MHQNETARSNGSIRRTNGMEIYIVPAISRIRRQLQTAGATFVLHQECDDLDKKRGKPKSKISASGTDVRRVQVVEVYSETCARGKGIGLQLPAAISLFRTDTSL